MTTEIATTKTWTADQIKLIQDTVAKGTTPDEFKLFLYTAQKYGFDPLVKQIWCVKYGNEPAAIFTGRDGFLSKAHESKQFDGLKTTVRVEPIGFSKKIKKKGYNGKADEWIDFKKESQLVAVCEIYRKDMSHTISVEVWEEEYSSGQSNWAKMPRTMISKVAESQALRKAFEIYGIYSEDEANAIEQTSTTVDANAVEILSDEMQEQINNCKTEDELKAIWNANKNLQGKVFFKEAITNRKAELIPTKSEVESKTPQPQVLPEQIILEIETATSMQNLNAIWSEYTTYHENQEFISLINKKKIAISKPIAKKLATA